MDTGNRSASRWLTQRTTWILLISWNYDSFAGEGKEYSCYRPPKRTDARTWRSGTVRWLNYICRSHKLWYCWVVFMLCTWWSSSILHCRSTPHKKLLNFEAPRHLHIDLLRCEVFHLRFWCWGIQCRGGPKFWSAGHCSPEFVYPGKLCSGAFKTIRRGSISLSLCRKFLELSPVLWVRIPPPGWFGSPEEKWASTCGHQGGFQNFQSFQWEGSAPVSILGPSLAWYTDCQQFIWRCSKGCWWWQDQAYFSLIPTEAVHLLFRLFDEVEKSHLETRGCFTWWGNECILGTFGWWFSSWEYD